MHPLPHAKPGTKAPRARTLAVARQPDRAALRRSALVMLALVGTAGLIAGATATAQAQDWQLQRVDDGTKPALAVTSEGDPVIVYMLERQDGWVRVAQLEGDGWRIDQIADGYFYGPPDIAAGMDGTVHAAYHDHQGSTFQPERGDAVHAVRQDGRWTLNTAVDAGHDGWDNRITVDATGRPHMVGVDPLDFGSEDGVEYYSLDADGSWTVETVGSGPQTYRWAVSVAVDNQQNPWVTYFDAVSSSLRIAGRTGDGWSVETVDDAGHTGVYSEIAIDPDGGQHVSYFEADTEIGTAEISTSGTVKHAYRATPDDAWQISLIDDLSSVVMGFTGARSITSVAVDAEASPWVAYSDETVMKIAHLVDGQWQVETVTAAGDDPLGQIVSLTLDERGRPHLAFAEVSSRGPLDGTVWYATRGQR